MANGWLEDKDQQFLYITIHALENAGTVAGNYDEKWQNVVDICGG